MIPILPTSKRQAVTWVIGAWAITSACIVTGFNRVLTADEDAAFKHVVTDVPLSATWSARMRNAEPGLRHAFVDATVTPAIQAGDSIADAAALWAWHHQTLLAQPWMQPVSTVAVAVPPVVLVAWYEFRIVRWWVAR